MSIGINNINYQFGFTAGHAAAKAEVKHGTWNTVVHSNNHITYYCPICGSIFNKGCADLGDYNYCPNCGARMDERG